MLGWPGRQQEHHERNLASVAGQQHEFSYTADQLATKTVAGQQQHQPKLTSVDGQQHESNSTTDRLLDSNKKCCCTANQDTRSGASLPLLPLLLPLLLLLASACKTQWLSQTYHILKMILKTYCCIIMYYTFTFELIHVCFWIIEISILSVYIYIHIYIIHASMNLICISTVSILYMDIMDMIHV